LPQQGLGSPRQDHGLEGGGTLDASVRAALEHQAAALLKEQLASEELRAVTQLGRLDAPIAGQSAELDALSSQRQLAEMRARAARDPGEVLFDGRSRPDRPKTIRAFSARGGQRQTCHAEVAVVVLPQASCGRSKFVLSPT
jgi:hypothetical protein